MKIRQANKILKKYHWEKVFSPTYTHTKYQLYKAVLRLGKCKMNKENLEKVEIFFLSHAFYVRKNTSELKAKLVDIGYDNLSSPYGTTLYVNIGNTKTFIVFPILEEDKLNHAIDLWKDEDLFLKWAKIAIKVSKL